MACFPCEGHTGPLRVGCGHQVPCPFENLQPSDETLRHGIPWSALAGKATGGLIENHICAE